MAVGSMKSWNPASLLLQIYHDAILGQGLAADTTQTSLWLQPTYPLFQKVCHFPHLTFISPTSALIFSISYSIHISNSPSITPILAILSLIHLAYSQLHQYWNRQDVQASLKKSSNGLESSTLPKSNSLCTNFWNPKKNKWLTATVCFVGDIVVILSMMISSYICPQSKRLTQAEQLSTPPSPTPPPPSSLSCSNNNLNLYFSLILNYNYTIQKNLTIKAKGYRSRELLHFFFSQ